MLIYPPKAVLLVAELLRLRGQIAEAAAVRAEIRLALPRFEGGPVQLVAAAATWALLGKEERSHELRLAEQRRAEQAVDRFDRIASERKFSFDGAAMIRGKLSQAMIVLENSIEHAVRCGDAAQGNLEHAAALDVPARIREETWPRCSINWPPD